MTSSGKFAVSGGVVGIGTDIAEVDRIRTLIDKYSDSFIERTFTSAEIAYCSKKPLPYMHYAARFAAKEAMAKALGTGFSDGVALKDLSVENDAAGTPHAVVSGRALEIMHSIGGSKMLISISHTKQFASAFAAVVK